MKYEYHIIVVGTDISGLITAYLSAKAGLKVLILDKSELSGNAEACGTFVISKKTLIQINPKLLENVPFERVLTTKSIISTNAQDSVEIRRKHKINKENDDVSYIFNKTKFTNWLLELAETEGAELQSNVIAKKTIINDGQVIGVEIHTGFKYKAMLTLINDDQQTNLLQELNVERNIDLQNKIIYASELLTISREKIDSIFNLNDKEGAETLIIGASNVNCLANLYTFEDEIQLNALVMPFEGEKPISEIDAMQALDEIKSHEALSSIFEATNIESRTISALQIPSDLNSQCFFGNGFLVTGTTANLYTMNLENIKPQLLAGLYAFETVDACNKNERADKKFSGLYPNLLKENNVLTSITRSNKMLQYLQNNPQFLSQYPQGITQYSRDLFFSDNDSNKNADAFEKLTDAAGGFFNLLKDFFGLRSRLK